MYIKYKDIKDKTIDEIKEQIGENTLLMSGDEFNSGGKEIEGVPIAVTPDGEEPIEESLIDNNIKEEEIYGRFFSNCW